MTVMVTQSTYFGRTANAFQRYCPKALIAPKKLRKCLEI